MGGGEETPCMDKHEHEGKGNLNKGTSKHGKRLGEIEPWQFLSRTGGGFPPIHTYSDELVSSTNKN